MTWRSILGSTLLVAGVLVASRLGRSQLVGVRHIPRTHRLQLLVASGTIVVTNLAVFTALERSSISLVLIALYTYPVMVALAAVRIWGDPLTASRVLALALASLGMVLVVVGPSLGQGGLTVDAAGLALGLVGAASNSLYALLAARGYPSLPAMQASATIGVLAAAGFLSTAALAGSLASVAEPLQTGSGWEWLALAAVIGQAIPAVAYIAGYRRVGATGASILMLLEPVVAVMLAVLLVSERPSPLQLVGGLMVLAGGVLVHVGDLAPRTLRGPAPGA